MSSAGAAAEFHSGPLLTRSVRSKSGFFRAGMVLPDRIELSTSPLPMECFDQFRQVAAFNDFNGPAQTTNLEVRSSNLFGHAIKCLHSEIKLGCRHR